MGRASGRREWRLTTVAEGVTDPSRAARMKGAAAPETEVRFAALDGFELRGTLYSAAGNGAPRTVVLINAGGGVPAALYARFARHLAAQGFPTFAYDYRGIGASRQAGLRGQSHGNEDWSEHDCGGAIAWMRARFPDAELVAVAHSFGTVLVGGAPNAGEISRFVFVGAHTGYFGDYRLRYRLPMTAVWHGAMPALTRAVGYFPGRFLRLGEDLPREVALQWAKRRTPELRPEHAVDPERARRWLARHRNLRGEALVVVVADDAFSTEAGTSRLLALFPGLEVRRERVAPADAGMKRIGHFGYFRRQAEAALWPRVVAFLRGAPA
jgi:predicted alpha/beta hydrolase